MKIPINLSNLQSVKLYAISSTIYCRLVLPTLVCRSIRAKCAWLSPYFRRKSLCSMAKHHPVLDRLARDRLTGRRSVPCKSQCSRVWKCLLSQHFSETFWLRIWVVSHRILRWKRSSVLNNSLIVIIMIPASSAVPNVVWVFPDVVGPYVSTVLLKPSRQESTNGFTNESYTSLFLVFVSNTWSVVGVYSKWLYGLGLWSNTCGNIRLEKWFTECEFRWGRSVHTF